MGKYPTLANCVYIFSFIISPVINPISDRLVIYTAKYTYNSLAESEGSGILADIFFLKWYIFYKK